MALASLKNGERSLTVNKKTLATNLQSTSRTAVIPYKAIVRRKGPISPTMSSSVRVMVDYARVAREPSPIPWDDINTSMTALPFW